jgi:hypothetical protein
MLVAAKAENSQTHRREATFPDLNAPHRGLARNTAALHIAHPLQRSWVFDDFDGGITDDNLWRATRRAGWPKD